MSTADTPIPSEPVETSPGELTKDEKMWAMFAHLSSILTSYVLALGFLGPLIIWLIKKDQSKFVDYHGKEALNFQLNMLVYVLISVALICVVVGIVLLIAIGIYVIVMPIIAGLNANSGQYYRYPLIYRVIK